MQILNAIVLGIVQGLTEFLPISSSGHLVLVQHFFQKGGQTGDLSLEIVLHLGSLLAVLIYFRNDILRLLASLLHWQKNAIETEDARNHRIVLYLIVATLVTGVVYVIAGDRIEAVFSKPLIVAVCIGITGIIIFMSDLVKNTNVKLANAGIVRSMIIGLGQGIAMLPGISRSGTTIATALYTGIRREEAARFSFLLSIPAILAANAGEWKELMHLSGSMIAAYVLGAMAAFVSGYLVISVLLRLIQQAKLKYFAVYCWVVSILSVVFILQGY